MIVYQCDLCNQIRECVQKEIDGKEYDLCLECWSPLEAKLKGKGRAKTKEPFRIYQPPLKVEESDDQEKPFPGSPPKIWLKSDPVN